MGTVGPHKPPDWETGAKFVTHPIGGPFSPQKPQKRACRATTGPFFRFLPKKGIAYRMRNKFEARFVFLSKFW